MEFKKIVLPFRVKKPLLSLGADLKNTVCFAYGNHAFISNDFGDLSEIENYRAFVKTVRKIPLEFKKKFKIIAYDPHPAYHSSNYIFVRRV